MSSAEEALQHLTQRMYAEVATMMCDAEMQSVVTDGLTVLYGPPMVRPDIGIITFQGGGADKSVQASAPKRLLYRGDPYKFGTALRRYMGAVGLSDTLANRTVAQAVIFPQAPTSQAGGWMAKTGPKARWREFSKDWTTRLVEAQQPKVVLVFGGKASAVLGIEWREIERKHKQYHMTFARADWMGIPTVFCHHLSIGCPESEAIRCMGEVKVLIDRR